MRKVLLSACLSAALATPAAAALKPGAVAPKFVTKAALKGKIYPFELAQLLKRGPVVLYFFPAAFTPGCTMEAHEFAEAMPAFKKLGAVVIGLAGDEIGKLAEFSVKECRNKFPVGVATTEIIKGFDVAIPLTTRTSRVSYVITPEGQIIHVHDAGDYRGHVSGTLAALREWQARK